MFTEKELNSIDRKYFEIIVISEYDVTVMSKNTKHVWYLHNASGVAGETVQIFHKHKANHPYHHHGRCGTLGKALRDIKSHDEFQLNGRKPVHT